MNLTSIAALCVTAVMITATRSVTAANDARDATTLTPSIYGPSTVRPNSTCMWEGTASGGTGPYDLSWQSSQGDYGSGQTFYATAPRNIGFYVYLTVEDANLDQVTVRKAVTVSSSAPYC